MNELTTNNSILESDFTPPLGLRHPHVQSIVSSTLPRKLAVERRAARTLPEGEELILNCSDGVRLLGHLDRQPNGSKGLVCLIHGWEGCNRSLYVLSATIALFKAGYDIFRLNLRDHGPTHHLNPELFHSARIQEVVDAIAGVQKHHNPEKLFLAGFSLGGNFTLRVALRAPENGIHLAKAIAVCPVLDPASTMHDLNTGWWVYEKYFTRRWKNSLRKKLEHFPELAYGETLKDLNTLDALNEFFVPNHTGYNTLEDYLASYKITDGVLANLNTPAHIIAAKDDPIIGARDLSRLANTPSLTIETTDYGGHCGFLHNYRLDSWVDGRLVDLIESAT